MALLLSSLLIGCNNENELLKQNEGNNEITIEEPIVTPEPTPEPEVPIEEVNPDPIPKPEVPEPLPEPETPEPLPEPDPPINIVPELSDAEKIQALEERGILPKLDRSDSLAGVDANNNGVRDDIEAYLEQHYSMLETEKYQAIMQTARAFQQKVLVDKTDAIKVREIARQGSRALNCLSNQFRFERSTFYSVDEKIESMTSNTKARLKAYLAFSKALDGAALTLPSGDTCDKY